MAMESSPEQPVALGRVVQAVKGWVERCGAVWVEAQVIQINRRAGSSTVFMTMRDTLAQTSASISCSTAVLDAAGPLTEGTTVTAWIKPTVWSKNGALSFECREIRIAGEGRLLAQLEQRKRLLQAEGLFDPARKKRLPFLPRTIGLVTGAGSAAERDVLTNIALRWPAAQIEVRHALVQGPKAAEEVMARLAELDANPAVDVIIIARGGGSLEDLLPFSDEGLVRAVAAARTPVVTAIGHEPDIPIVDLAADLRASTPTDAAKRVVPDAREESERVTQAIGRIRGAVVNRVRVEQEHLDALRSRPVLRDPAGSFDIHYDRLENLRLRLDHAIDRSLTQHVTSLQHDLSRVRAMSPKATLERGYAVLVDGEGGSVASIHDVDLDDDVMAYLADGKLTLGVRAIDDPTGQATASMDDFEFDEEN
ncbi:MAG: exodeoxyribonuclease VII large subunit [Luteococcus sp.]|uniref:exodeoxyribonuclease VII large subunit n=1 Tax=Luteococcus sp. TaxID=1969402 RepID=UPI002649899B|nr:exodeoxyribonuclease VII large subunit [Luteococcus sp.]MDN5563018.1 exodeoxyribonuclease VII large subunit [Luteococcus sp.]